MSVAPAPENVAVPAPKPLRVQGNLTPPRRPRLPLLPLGDAALLRLGLSLGLAMGVIFGGTILLGKTFALMTIVPFALCIIAMAARDQTTAVMLYMGYAAMEGMYKYTSGFSQAVYMIGPALLGGVAVAWGLSRRARGFTSNPPPMLLTVFLFISIAAIQILNPNGSGFVSGVATSFLWYIGPLLMYLVAASTVRSIKQITGFCYALVIIAVATSVFAIFQHQKGRQWTIDHMPGYEKSAEMWWGYTDDKGKAREGSFRPASTFAIAGGGATVAQTGVMTALGLLFVPGITRLRKVGLIVSLPINLLALLLYSVRLVVVVTVIAVPVLLILHARSRRELMNSLGSLAGILVVAVVGIGLAQVVTGGKILYRYRDTLSDPVGRFQRERGRNVTTFFVSIGQYPFGIGYQRGISSWEDRTGTKTVETNRETQFGATLADMGLPGVVLLTLLVYGLTFRGWRIVRRIRHPNLRPLSILLLVSMFCYLPGWLAGPVMQGATHFWFAAGILMALPLVERRELAAMEEAAKRRDGADAGALVAAETA